MTEMCGTHHRRNRFSAIVVTCTALVLTAAAVSAQPPSLGTARAFAVLGATTVTNTGATVVTGELGVSPGTSITGFPPGVVLGGTTHSADVAAADAQADAGRANARLKAMVCPAINNLTGQVLGTDVQELPPGVYCFDSSAQLTGTLLLSGAGPWVFQVGSALTTASNSIVHVDNGRTCNAYWQIGSSATLGTGTQFAGHILALASITMTTGASTSGSAVALTAAVTMDTNRAAACAGPVIPDPGDDDEECDHRKCKCCKHHKDRDHDDDCDNDHRGGRGNGHDDHKHHKDKDHDRDRDNRRGDNDRHDNDRDRDRGKGHGGKGGR